MKTIRILNLGAGVQSTALYLLAMRQDEPEHVPAFDHAIFADTQEEPRAVYDHIDWLKSLGGPPITIETIGKLGDHLVNGINSTGQRFATIPSFMRVEGQAREGRAKRQCTHEYKISVIERTIRRKILGLEPRCHIPADTLVIQYMGLSYDEPGRITKVQDRYRSVRRMEPRFPLWDMEWTRADCAAYLKDVAPDRKIVKSACVFCPYHDNATWRDMRDNDPESWARALEIDSAIRDHGSVCTRDLKATAFLHRSCLPLDQAPIDAPQSNADQYLFGFAQECEGMCGI